MLMAQAPDTLWTKTYGGVESDFGIRVFQTSDSGYILFSNTRSYGPGGQAIWLLRTNPCGDTLWSKLYGDSYGVEGLAMEKTNDGGYVITGYHTIGGIDDDVWLIKIDSLGDTVWTKTYGTNGGMDFGFHVKQTLDGGYIVVGGKYGVGYSDMWLLKTDALGDTLWTKTYGGSDYDYGNSIAQMPDSGYVVVGTTVSIGPWLGDIWLLKTNTLGDTLWTKTFGGSDDDYSAAVELVDESGFIVLGMTNSYGAGGYDVWLIRIDNTGDTLWTRTYGTSGWDECYSLSKTPDGGYVMAGYSGPVFSAEGYILKVDSAGNVIWSSTIGGEEDDFLRDIKPSIDGGYIIIGNTCSYGVGESDIWLIKTAPDTLGFLETSPTKARQTTYSSTILTGPLVLPTGMDVKIFDITGRQIHTINPTPGIYFIEIDGKIRQKIIKIK